MSSDYNYDADAQFFPFFVLTVTAIITLPLTYTVLRKPSDAVVPGKSGTQISSSFTPENADIIESQRLKQKRKELRLKRILTTASGWLLMAYMVYLMFSTVRTGAQVWNPYDLLKVSLSASEKEINSRYRKLSTIMHPDKRKPNPATNLTLEVINDEWVEIVKAYKALTDEEIRNNYIMYGNPDGKQSTSFGIALPHFLVADGSGKYVLAFYGLLLGVGLPWLVGKWWYGMQKLNKEKILVTSAGNIFKEFKEKMDTTDVAFAISAASEFPEILKGVEETGLGKLEKQLQSDKLALPPSAWKKINSLEDPTRRKTLALLWAYASRQDTGDTTLESEKFEVAPTALQINEAFVSLCLAFGFTGPVMSCYQLSQCLVQAVPFHKPWPLLQLPNFTPGIVAAIEKSLATDRKGHLTLQAFMALPKEQRQTLARSAGLSTENLRVAEDIARQIPRLQIEKTFFKVQGEKYLLPSSLVQFVIKARIIPPGTLNVPPVNPKDLLDIDPAEGDLSAQKIEQEQHYPPLAFAPYYAKDRAPRFHAFLADSRQAKIAIPPFTFLSYGARPFETDAQGNLKPTFNMITLKMQFQAPPAAGEYKFQLHLVSDSYLGFDEIRDAVMVIEDASKGQEVEEEDDISEPEEDSIAGQMAALKGGEAPKPKKPRKKPALVVDEESDYESGTDEDVDTESETDTETDSDLEK